MEKKSEKNNKDRKDPFDLFDDIRQSLAAAEEPEKESKKAAADADVVDSLGIKEDPDADQKEKLALEYYKKTKEAGKGDQVEVLASVAGEMKGVDAKTTIPRKKRKNRQSADLSRSIVLESYSEDALFDDDEKSPGRKKLTWKMVFLGVVLLGLLIAMFFFVISNTAEQKADVSSEEVLPTRTPYGEGPVPSLIELPGGWAFSLSKGTVNIDGRWVPFGAEWLEGTDICRWVALPWSVQLEAVIRTLSQGDEIKLKMSNYDELIYRVEEIVLLDEDARPEELNRETPSIVIFLAHNDSGRQWVLTGLLEYNQSNKKAD